MAAASRSAARPAACAATRSAVVPGFSRWSGPRSDASNSSSVRVPARTSRAAAVTVCAAESPALRAISVSGCDASSPTWSDTIASSVACADAERGLEQRQPGVEHDRVAGRVLRGDAVAVRGGAIASRSETRAAARTSCSGASPSPPGAARKIARKCSGGIVDVEPRQNSLAPPRATSRRLAGSPPPGPAARTGARSQGSCWRRRPAPSPAPRPRSTHRRRVAERASGANTGPSASADRTMSTYVVSEKSWAGVMLPGLAADTSSTHASDNLMLE